MYAIKFYIESENVYVQYGKYKFAAIAEYEAKSYPWEYEIVEVN